MVINDLPLEIRLFNTRTRRVEPLVTRSPGCVKLYCCGPTVYNFQHIGNLRTYIFEDLLVRTLRFVGYAVNHVMNITDVGHLVSDGDEGDDKMKLAAKREQRSALEVAAYYTEVFFADCAKLNIERPTTVCKATDHIADMIALIQKLEQRGLTYQAGGNVYYDVAKFPSYGELARLDMAHLKAGARVVVDCNKRNPFDFVLWFTKSKFENQELTWDSPWGRGYPGWHIECSAMAMRYLGDTFDIHCGGIDHIPVHHTNEIAQSEGATGAEWVRYWVHGEFLLINAEKMAKSKGNFYTLQSLIDQGFDPIAYRLLCLSASYRTQLNFTSEALQGAANSLGRLRATLCGLGSEALSMSEWTQLGKEYVSRFVAAYQDDLNSPRALAIMWDLLGDGRLSNAEKRGLLFHFDKILGLGMASWREAQIEVPPEVQKLFEQRSAARALKSWRESDLLRDEISRHGFEIIDSPQGSKLVRK